MKKVYVAVVTALLFGVTCSASSLSPGPGCPGHKCPLPPVQTVSSSTLLGTTNLASLAAPATTNLTSSLTTASTLLSQSTAAPALASPAPSNSSLGINPVVPDLKIVSVQGSSSVSEPSTLLLLSAGLLFVPLLRKSFAKKDLHVRLA